MKHPEFLAIGICLGVAMGVVFDNLALGIALGVLFGVVFAQIPFGKARGSANANASPDEPH